MAIAAAAGVLLDAAWSRQQLSDVLGTASFVVWLFAQSPQLYENYRNGSCDGLSVVFLAQWMAGDVTNLLGSVLTQQLPFQIAVATYFCCVDVCIMAQYYHYWQRDRRKAAQQQRLARRFEHAIQRAGGTYDTMPSDMGASVSSSAMLERGMSVQSVRSSTDRRHHRSLTSVGGPSSKRHQRSESLMQPPRRRMTSDLDSQYRALGEAAKSVAELASETDRRIAAREARWQTAWAMALAEGAERKSTHALREEDLPTTDMTASVTSSASCDSDVATHRLMYASTPNIRLADPPSPVLGRRRGRDMRRMAGVVEALRMESGGEGEEVETTRRSSTTSSARKGSRPPAVSRSSTRGPMSPLSVRQSGMVLLGLTALIAYGGVPSTSTALGRSTRNAHMGDGHVLGGPTVRTHAAETAADMHYVAPAHPYQWSTLDDPHHPPRLPPPTWERTIGRISAWTCTILYITSRMPQIWINAQRKSVQGLSILLFVAAATGNALYTLSILLSPRAQGTPQQRTAYLMESLPFLLGSGGTLVFDGIIVAQWLAWRGKAPSGEEDGVVAATTTATTTMVPAMLPSTGSYLFSPPLSGRRSRKTSTRSQWHSLERRPLLE